MGFVREKKFRLMILSLSLFLFFSNDCRKMNAVVLSIVGYTLQTKVTFDQRDFFFIRIYLSFPVYFDTDTSKVSRANPFPLDSRERGCLVSTRYENLFSITIGRCFLHSFAAVSSDKVGRLYPCLLAPCPSLSLRTV